MAWNWLKKLLGIHELENRVALIEAEKSSLEQKVIFHEDSRALITKTAEQQILQETTAKYLTALNIPLLSSPSTEVSAAIEAAEVVEKYNFKRFIPPIEQEYPSAVISFKEFQEHPELYFHKLSKGCLGFPVGLNFEGVNKILSQFGSISITAKSYFSNNGTFDFTCGALYGYGSFNESHPVGLLFNKTGELADLNRGEKSGSWFRIDTLDFLANYNGLEQFVLDRPELDKWEKEGAIKALHLSRFTYLTALETIAHSRIADSSLLINYTGNEISDEKNDSNELILYSGEESPAELRKVLRNSFLTDLKGTTYREIQKLLPIRSRERFRQLASERTKEILSKDKNIRGLTNTINKSIKDYSIGECVVLACYFARNIITKYETLDDAVKRIILGDGNNESEVNGKCTDYTGLALHYLREYLVPLHPDKFKNWKFGYDADQIGEYKHCYMKIVHLKPDEKIEVYFVDPTSLANKGISALKTPNKVMEMMDTSRLPLEIVRDAEDLMQKPIK